MCAIIADSFSLPLFFLYFSFFSTLHLFSLLFSHFFSPEARQIHQIFFASAPSGPPVSSNVLSRAYRSASVYRLARPHLKSRYLCLPFIIVRFEDRGKMITCVEGVRGANCLESDFFRRAENARSSLDLWHGTHRSLASLPSSSRLDRDPRRRKVRRERPRTVPRPYLSTLYFCHFENTKVVGGP